LTKEKKKKKTFYFWREERARRLNTQENRERERVFWKLRAKFKEEEEENARGGEFALLHARVVVLSPIKSRGTRVSLCC